MDLIEIANLAYELDEGRTLVNAEAAGVFPAMRDYCAEINQKHGSNAVLCALNDAVEQYWVQKFDPLGIGRTKKGRICEKSFTIKSGDAIKCGGLRVAHAFNYAKNKHLSVISSNRDTATIRGMPSDWYAAATTIRRAINHNLSCDPSDTIDWQHMTKNAIEKEAKARKGEGKAKPNPLMYAVDQLRTAIEADKDPVSAKAYALSIINEV
jgi:hypothetical protein